VTGLLPAVSSTQFAVHATVNTALGLFSRGLLAAGLPHTG